MSSRNLRRLREEKDAPGGVDGLPNIKEKNSEEKEDESEDDEKHGRRQQAAFHLMMMDDDDSDSSSSSSEEEEVEHEEKPGHDDNPNDVSSTKIEKNNDLEDKEDIDAILSEFKVQASIESLDGQGNGNGNGHEPSFDAKFAGVLYGNDSREYNLDNAMRNMLNGTVDSGTAMSHDQQTQHQHPQHQSKRRSSKQNQSLFARQRDSWGKRPSSYIGGGLGMQQLDNVKNKLEIPWPYSVHDNDGDGDGEGFKSIPTDMQQQWCSFQRSNTYSDRVTEYEHYIANTGDVNTMAMHIADNPFVIEPMFHFAIFFLSIGENDKGTELLKRILWVMECASCGNFFHGHERCDLVHLMDSHRDENEIFFQVLFRLAQSSCMVGCVVTALAVGRFLLSLDPMRDPTGILMVLDYYALATMREKDTLFLLKLVDSGVVKVCHAKGQDSRHVCGVREMPNWAYNYALAMYRKSHFDREEDDEDCISVAGQADKALDFALARYPFIPRLLLEKNGVDMKARSFQTDWPSIMESLDKLKYNGTSRGVEKISSIFVERNHKLWSGDDVVKWLYRGCQRMFEMNVTNRSSDGILEDNISPLEALDKYSVFDPIDFQDRFLRIPTDANALDPGLMDAALKYSPNRRRFLILNRQHGGAVGGF